MRRLDRDIRVLERAYDMSASHLAWLDGLHEALKSFLDGGYGVSIGSWAIRGAEFSDLSPMRGDLRVELREVIGSLVWQIPTEVRRSLYGPMSGDFVGAAEQAFPGSLELLLPDFRARGVGSVRDIFGVLMMGHPGRNGLVMTAPSRTPVVLAPSTKRKLRRLLTHVSAGLRLRLSTRQPEAVLTPSGDLLHAEGEATSADAREVLRHAVKSIERSRGKLRRTDPEEALSLWKGLVDGRWSVVDWVESGSRRYLVAHQNHVSARDPRALTRRELDVAEYLVQGRSTSEIAYALGLGVGTVSRLSRDVLKKLGSARRSDLAALFGNEAPWSAEVSSSSVALTAGTNENLWAKLSGAERAVVEAVLAGQPVAQVARARKVSVKTVSNQLGAVYARFGVRGRTELAALLGARTS